MPNFGKTSIISVTTFLFLSGVCRPYWFLPRNFRRTDLPNLTAIFHPDGLVLCPNRRPSLYLTVKPAFDRINRGLSVGNVQTKSHTSCLFAAEQGICGLRACAIDAEKWGNAFW